MWYNPNLLYVEVYLLFKVLAIQSIYGATLIRAENDWQQDHLPKAAIDNHHRHRPQYRHHNLESSPRQSRPCSPLPLGEPSARPVESLRPPFVVPPGRPPLPCSALRRKSFLDVRISVGSHLQRPLFPLIILMGRTLRRKPPARILRGLQRRNSLDALAEGRLWLRL